MEGVLPGARDQMLGLLSTLPGDHSPQQQLSAVLGVVLDSAVGQGDCDLARALLRAGAELSANVLISAVRGNQEELVAALLDHGAGIDDWGRNESGEPRDTPLHVASTEGHLGLTLLLVQRGADKNFADAWGWTPLHAAASGGHVAVVRALANAGADRHRRMEDSHLSPFDVASSSEVVRLMLELGVDVNAVGASGITGLHLGRGKAVIDTLVDAGARIEARDHSGRTPLLANLSLRRFDSAKALLDHGADVNTHKGDGQTPLMIAAYLARVPGALEMVDGLLRLGADETMADVDGRTAADLAGSFPTRASSDIEENVERVQNLLANAPGDRVWRRRGPLLLCVSRHSRERLRSTSIADTQGGTDSSQDATGRLEVERTADDSWTRMATWVAALGLGQEGIFRAIVGYL